MNPKISQKITNHLLSGEEGVALAIVMLISALLLGLGLALSTNTILETGVSSNNERRIAAFYAAQIGLERTVRDFRNNYTVNNLLANQQVLYSQISVADSGINAANYTVTVTRRDSPVGSPMAPFPIFYIVTSEGRQVSPNASASVSSVQLQQTLSVTPLTLANFTLFYNTFAWSVSFQSTFRLSGRLAVNDPGGVHIDRTTIIGHSINAGKFHPFL